MTKFLLCFLLCWMGTAGSLTSLEFPLDPDLQKELVQMSDQITKDSDSKGLRLARLKEIVKTYGWPGNKLVGEEGVEAMGYLIRFCKDLPFQEKCLSLYEKAVLEGDAKGLFFAIIKDNLLVSIGKAQIYGTYFKKTKCALIFAPIDDFSNLEARRKLIGLYSFNEYIKYLEDRFHRPAVFALTPEKMAQFE